MTKRKAWVIAFLAFVFCFSLALLAACGKEQPLQGEKGDKGEQGPAGKDGKDFYEGNEQGLFFYELPDGTYAVAAGMSRMANSIEVPATYNGKNVTAIMEEGFADCKNLAQVTLPAAIKNIPERAFADSPALHEVKSGDTVLPVCTFNGVVFGAPEGYTIAPDAFENTAVTTITASDAHNTSKVKVKVSNAASGVTSVKIKAALNDTTDFVRESSIAVTNGSGEEDVDFGTYGLFKNIKVDVLNGEQSLASVKTGGVKVTASHYNFAAISGSYGVLVFSLKLHEISQNGAIPTFIDLERADQYDWDNMPYNASYLPTVPKARATASGFHDLRAPMREYIKELNEISPDAKFSLYLGEFYSEMILELMVANGIPQERWDAVLLSDGSGTARLLAKVFPKGSGSDEEEFKKAQEKYDTLKYEWMKAKQYVAFNQEYDRNVIKGMAKSSTHANDEFQIFDCYDYIIAKEEPNVEWWVNRLRPTENLIQLNTKFAEGIRAVVTELYTNSLLAALNEDQNTKFKALYKFDDEMFSAATESGKKSLVILGTDWNTEQNTIEDYIRLTMAVYGTEDYEYYYKGHPGYSTAQYPDRETKFTSIETEEGNGFELHELDNAIAAEIIIYFHPEIYMVGYPSSTYESLTDSQNEQAMVLFGMTKAQAAADSLNAAKYDQYFDMFASAVTSGNSSELQSTYSGVTFSDGDYLIEFNDTADFANQGEAYGKHEIAVYVSSEKKVKYYKENGGSYKEVDKDGNDVNP